MYNKSLKKIPIDYRRGTHRSTAMNTCKAIVSGRRPFWTDKLHDRRCCWAPAPSRPVGRATGGKGVFVRYGGSESIRRRYIISCNAVGRCRSNVHISCPYVRDVQKGILLDVS